MSSTTIPITQPEPERCIELRSKAVIEFKGIDQIEEHLMNPGLYGWKPIERDITDRWYLELTTTDSANLYLTVIPIPTHREYYMLGNLCHRKVAIMASIIHRTAVANGRWGFRNVATEEWTDEVQICAMGLGGYAAKTLLKEKARLFNDPSLINEDCFKIIIEIIENDVILENLAPLPTLPFRLAGNLEDETQGDVIIVVSDASSGEDRKLYAWKHILEAGSEYFACRFKPEWTSNKIKSESDPNPPPSSSQITTTPAQTNTTTDSRLVLYFNSPHDDIDFITLHNIIYYIYTQSVNLRARGRRILPAHDTTLLPGHPHPADAFDLYRNSKKFLLDPLTDYCFEFLKRSTTYVNVTERLFRPDAELQHHDSLREMYLEKLIGEYDNIKESDRWREIMCNELEVSSVARGYHEILLFEISRRLTAAPVKRARSMSPSPRCAQQQVKIQGGAVTGRSGG